MKIYLLPFLLTFLCLNLPVTAQDCSGLSSLQKGTKYEMTTYDSKDKKLSLTKFEVKDVKTEAGKKVWTLQMNTSEGKGKGDENVEGEFNFICDGQTIKLDMKPALEQAFAELEKGDMEVIMEGTYIEIPTSLKPGQTLPDGKINLKVIAKSTNQEFMNVEIIIKDRKVVQKEKITTSAGTFDTYKITYTMESKITAMGNAIPSGDPATTVEYFDPSIGSIRSEQYSKGKLQSYTVLTSFSK